MARAAGPPRSNSQYHSANTMTLVSQIEPPLTSSVMALVPPWPLASWYTRVAADHNVARLAVRTSSSPAVRTSTVSRLIRFGFRNVRTANSSTSSAGSSTFGGNARLLGMCSCNAMMMANPMVTGRPGSPAGAPASPLRARTNSPIATPLGSSRPATRFIAGEPINPATNTVAGRW